MVTIQKNSPWHNRAEVKRGDYGELLAQRYFENKGFIVYSPVTDAPHGFDRYIYKDGKQYALEVKTKAMCRKYPETGFDKRHYDRYCTMSKENNMPVIIVFVDHEQRAMYGNTLSALNKPLFVEELGDKGHYPKFTTHKGGINPTVYFHKSSMKLFRNLTGTEVETLKLLSKETS